MKLIVFVILISILTTSISSLRSSDVCVASTANVGCKRSDACKLKLVKCEGLHSYRCGQTHCALNAKSCNDLLNINLILHLLKT